MTKASQTPAAPDLKGPWSMPEVEAFLAAAVIPMRLAANGASGFPVQTPLWFRWDGGALWAAVQPSTAIAKALARDPRCTFDISIETPPYKGVRGRGRAEIVTDGLPVLRQLLRRYLADAAPEFQQRLLDRSDGEIALRIRPNNLTAWDFSKRMRG